LSTAPIDHLLAMALDACQESRLGRAAELCQAILAREPHHLDATHLLGVLAARTGRAALGERLLTDAVALAPRGLRHYSHLVTLLRTDRSFSRARAVYENAIQLNAGDAVAYNHLGLVAFVAQHVPGATDCFERAIVLRPDFAFAHYNLGLALQVQGRNRDAAASYRNAVALAPRFIEAHSKLGDLLHADGNRSEAMACFRRASAADPGSSLALLNDVKRLLDEDEVTAAENCLRRASALDPRDTELHRVLGNILWQRGCFAEAIACFEQAIALEPQNTAAYLNLVHSKKLTEHDLTLVERLRSLLPSDTTTDRDRINLHFALGKAFDDLASYDIAIRHFDDGNRMMRRYVSFDRVQHQLVIDRTIVTFTSEFFHRYGALGSESEVPIFVLGMMRSGTTLIERILARHPAIRGGGELPFWAERATELSRAGTAGIPETAVRAVTDDYQALLAAIAPDARRVVDKMPHNFMLIGLIHWLFPKARIIHCRRHPVDTCLSIYGTLFDMRHDFAYDRSDIVAFYEQYLRVMAHWRAILPSERFLEIDYEDLVADSERATRRLIAFSGLSWHDACLEPASSQHIVKTASAWQARQPIYTSSVARWRRYEPWLGEFTRLLPETDYQTGSALSADPGSALRAEP
jgi:tetratricopeptide (TPR) repeat protein